MTVRGKYDNEVSALQELLGGAVVLIVVGGYRGTGLACALPQGADPRPLGELLMHVGKEIANGAPPDGSYTKERRGYDPNKDPEVS